MNTLTKEISDQHALKKMIIQANSGIWDGKENTRYFEDSRWHWIEKEMMIIFTRDTGYHSGGWWKNPDYERCYHLSISFMDRFGNRKPHNKKKAERMVKLLFGQNANLTWCEPPYSKEGIQNEVWHYRLFCDPSWKPLKPRGEVYSTQFTEQGWKSFSELNSLTSHI